MESRRRREVARQYPRVRCAQSCVLGLFRVRVLRGPRLLVQLLLPGVLGVVGGKAHLRVVPRGILVPG